MKIIRGESARLVRENNRLKAENAKLKAIVDYIALCDYPEIFEEDEESEGEVDD